MPRTGRPKRVFEQKDWATLDDLCGIQCTAAEITAILKIDEATLNRIIEDEKGLTFSEYFSQKSSSGKSSLRRMQYLSAQSGNVTMQIHLGKHWLGQIEKQAFDHTSSDKSMSPANQLNKLTDEELATLISKLGTVVDGQ